jgi:MinD-like ATPase involved in chromosome partitioning or flagellar assembly
VRRLTLIIADWEKEYVDALAHYILEKFSGNYLIHSFTNETSLADHLTEENAIYDILLINSSFNKDCLPLKSTGVVIYFSEEMVNKRKSESNFVYKYQHGDQIIDNIMRIYSEKSSINKHMHNNSKKTKLVAVYSPAGGVGKSTLALNASIQCARNSMEVFYLNLENSNTTECLFSNIPKPGISNIIYYLKEKAENISAKIEEIKYLEPDYNIHLLAPADNILDLEELLPDELEYLLCELKETENYDVIFIDMPSIFNKKTLAVFDVCDDILLIYTQQQNSIAKIKIVIQELNLCCEKFGSDYMGKVVPVINKFRTDIQTKDIDGCIEGYSIESVKYIIPYCQDIALTWGRDVIVSECEDFYEGVQKIVSRYF